MTSEQNVGHTGQRAIPAVTIGGLMLLVKDGNRIESARMRTTDRDIAENTLRLIEKARRMSSETAVAYLTPLASIPTGSLVGEAAIMQISKLLDQLQSSSVDTDDAWRDAVTACMAWRDNA